MGRLATAFGWTRLRVSAPQPPPYLHPTPDSNAVAGESALDRIACGLGGKIILPMIKQHIMQMLQNRKSTPLHAQPHSVCMNMHGLMEETISVK